MARCLHIFYLVSLVIGYPVDDVEDVPLPPSYMEQPSQWQSQQANFRQQPSAYNSQENYFEAYAQAGNGDPIADEQQYDTQYPRMAAAMDPEAIAPANDPPLTDSNENAAAPGGTHPAPGSVPIPVTQPVSQPVPQPQPQPAYQASSQSGNGRVIPVYTPPKNKHTDKEEEPFLTPQWSNDDGIADNGRDPKIAAALEAITADLIGRGKELTNERKWTKQVESMLELYKEKVANVHAHTEQIRDEMKTLLKKKRQIENVEVQNSLGQKLRLAQGDLEALDGAMSHVQSKADEFAEKKKKLEKQIEKINDHLKNLQHKQGAEAEAAEQEADNELDEESSPSEKELSSSHEEGHKGGHEHEHEHEEEDEEGNKTDKAHNAANKTKADKTKSGKNETEEEEEEEEGSKAKGAKAEKTEAEEEGEDTKPKKRAKAESPINQTSTETSKSNSSKTEEADFRAKISSFRKVRKHPKKSLFLADED